MRGLSSAKPVCRNLLDDSVLQNALFYRCLAIAVSATNRYGRWTGRRRSDHNIMRRNDLKLASRQGFRHVIGCNLKQDCEK